MCSGERSIRISRLYFVHIRPHQLPRVHERRIDVTQWLTMQQTQLSRARPRSFRCGSSIRATVLPAGSSRMDGRSACDDEVGDVRHPQIKQRPCQQAAPPQARHDTAERRNAAGRPTRWSGRYVPRGARRRVGRTARRATAGFPGTTSCRATA